ncbi:MAG TPA: hypothetical protein VFM65_10065 [Flavobacteriaceae bacterium]|nr:hypothetical protein [Flavobacteriaceae bacterium]
MQKSIYKKFLVIVSLLLVFGFPQQATAQLPPAFEDFMDDDGSGPPPGAPINGFVGIALAVGVYFGIRKLRNKKE